MESRKILKFFVFLTLFGINLAQIERNCYSCNSTENFYCQSNPEKLDKSVYTCQGKICNEINVDGVIIKGCIVTLEGLFCNNKDYCNENTHQFDCIQCDSTNNPSCKNNVSSITTTCKSLMCYTSSDAAGNILRGCTESSELKTLNSCNNAEKCNNADYNSCYECKGTDCLEPSPTTPTCQTDQKCFTKLQSDGSIERGCSTNLTCNNGECEECSGENCNTVILPKDRLKCLQCNGTTECNNGDISLGKYCSKVETNDKCFAYAVASGLMYRGCLSVDKKCDSSNCETCDSENCNNWKFTDRPSKLSCYKCENCSSIEESLEPVSCGSYSFNEQEKCYTFVNNATKTVERGCYLGTKDIETKCGSGQCTTCFEDKCNNKSVISCYDCLDCLTTTNSTPTSLCTVGEMCISRILGESQVFRGCSAKKCQDGEICKDCNDDKCNDGVFPEDRLTCMQCDSESESDECSKGLGAKKLCTKYKKDDKCFQLVNENNLIKRGCLSDIENTNITCNDKTHCKECSRENCNDISLKITAHISCVQCQNCTTNLPKSEKCSYELFYYEEAEEKCYVQNVTESNTTVTNRGCLFDLPGKECQENCETCGVDGCNQYGPDYKEYPDFQCYICHGKDCTGKVEKCSPIPTSENGGPGCFVERRKDFIIRDCISNADKWNSTLTGKYVYKCLEDSCNDGAAPGSAIALQLSSSMLIAFVALVFLL